MSELRIFVAVIAGLALLDFLSGASIGFKSVPSSPVIEGLYDVGAMVWATYLLVSTRGKP